MIPVHVDPCAKKPGEEHIITIKVSTAYDLQDFLNKLARAIPNAEFTFDRTGIGAGIEEAFKAERS